MPKVRAQNGHYLEMSLFSAWKNGAMPHTPRMCGNQKRVKHGQDGKRRHNKGGQIDRARDVIIVSRREERRGEKR
jgi:hypothetical protein